MRGHNEVPLKVNAPLINTILFKQEPCKMFQYKMTHIIYEWYRRCAFQNYTQKTDKCCIMGLAPLLRNPGSATVNIISMQLKQLKLGKNALISPPCNHMSQNVFSLDCD